MQKNPRTATGLAGKLLSEIVTAATFAWLAVYSLTAAADAVLDAADSERLSYNLSRHGSQTKLKMTVASSPFSCNSRAVTSCPW